MFRSAEDARATAARLRRSGFVAVCAPALAPVALAAPPPADRFDVGVATSARALDFLSDPLLASIGALPLYVVGRAGRLAAERRGLVVAAEAPDVGALARRLLGALPDGARALYLAGADRKPDLEAALTGRLAVCPIEVYAARERTDWNPDEASDVAGAEAALHYSRRSAEIATRLAVRAGLAERWRAMTHVAISPDAAAPLAAIGVAAAVANAPNEASMFESLRHALRPDAPDGAH